MDKPLKIGDELWWAPSLNTTTFICRTEPGEDFRRALRKKVADLVERQEFKHVVEIVESYLPGVQSYGIDPDQVADAIVSYGGIAVTLERAESLPSATIEEAKCAIDEQDDLEVESILTKCDAHMDS